MRAPAFQFYADDFLAGTLDMSQEDVGAYIRLLCHQWSRGCIPVETERQQRLAGGSVSVHVISKFSTSADGMLRNERLEKERVKQQSFREKQAEKGRKSALARTAVEPRLNRGSIPAAVRFQPEANSPSPSPSPNNKTEAPASPWCVAFGIELPEPLRTTPCLDAALLWLSYKRERKEGYKAIGLKAAVAKWAREFSPDQFPGAVENSMASGWKGIFKSDSFNGSQPSKKPSKEISVFDSL